MANKLITSIKNNKIPLTKKALAYGAAGLGIVLGIAVAGKLGKPDVIVVEEVASE